MAVVVQWSAASLPSTLTIRVQILMECTFLFYKLLEKIESKQTKRLICIKKYALSLSHAKILLKSEMVVVFILFYC